MVFILPAATGGQGPAAPPAAVETRVAKVSVAAGRPSFGGWRLLAQLGTSSGASGVGTAGTGTYSAPADTNGSNGTNGPSGSNGTNGTNSGTPDYGPSGTGILDDAGRERDAAVAELDRPVRLAVIALDRIVRLAVDGDLVAEHDAAVAEQHDAERAGLDLCAELRRRHHAVVRGRRGRGQLSPSVE